MDAAPGSPRPGRHGLVRPRPRWIVVLVAAVVVASVATLLTLGRSSGPETPSTYSIFGDAVPPVPSVTDDKAVELGVRFTTSTPGWVVKIRYYRGPENTGQHDGTLWGPTGEPLAHASFAASTGTGWQEAALDAPVRTQSGATYTASYTAPDGHYAADAQTPSLSAPVTTRALTAVEGVYRYGSGLPQETFQGLNYYVDVVFTTTAPPAPAPGPGPATTVDRTPTPTQPRPSGSGKPGPTNTGVPAGTTLTPYTGPRTITENGTVIDSKDVTGALVIEAKDVVIRSSKIHGDPDAVAGVYVKDTGSATITDSEIYDFQVGITYSNWTAIRVDLHDLTFDGMKIGSNVRLQDSWVHDPKPSADAHWDGGQVQAGITDTVISGNTIDVRGGDANSALFLTPDLGPSSKGPLTVTGNWFDGGNFTLAILDGDGGKYFISPITVTDNRFGRAARYGPANIKVPITQSGNVWDDTGETLRL